MNDDWHPRRPWVGMKLSTKSGGHGHMTNILDELERRRTDTVKLPRDKSQWTVTVTSAELDALIRVARAAEAYTQADALSWRTTRDELADALQELRGLGNPAKEMAQLQQDLGLHD